MSELRKFKSRRFRFIEPGRSLSEVMERIDVAEFMEHRQASGYQMCIRGMYQERQQGKSET